MASERRRSRLLPDEHAPSASPVPVRPPAAGSSAWSDLRGGQFAAAIPAVGLTDVGRGLKSLVARRGPRATKARAAASRGMALARTISSVPRLAFAKRRFVDHIVCDTTIG